MILHLLGYDCNLCAGIGDQLKTLNVHEIIAYVNSLNELTVFFLAGNVSILRW